MSKWDKLIIAAAVIAVALFVFVLASEQMSSSLVSAVVSPAGESPERFAEFESLVADGSLTDTQFSKMTSDDINDYYFVDYTLSLNGVCPFPAKWATVSLIPATGDIVVMQSDPATIAPFVGGLVTGTLLTTNPDAQRTVWVEYYILGRMLTSKATQNP